MLAVEADEVAADGFARDSELARESFGAQGAGCPESKDGPEAGRQTTSTGPARNAMDPRAFAQSGPDAVRGPPAPRK